MGLKPVIKYPSLDGRFHDTEDEAMKANKKFKISQLYNQACAMTNRNYGIDTPSWLIDNWKTIKEVMEG